MRPKRRVTNFPVRWQPYAELTTAAAVACGGEGSLHTSPLGGGQRDDIVERNLLSQFKGDAKVQVTDDRGEPPLALSLRVGSQEEPPPESRLRFRHAPPTRQSPSLLPARSISVPPQTYAPAGSSPAGAAGLASPQLGSNNTLQLPPLGLGATATPPQPRCGVCSLHYDRLAAELLKRVSADLDRRVALLRQELSAEVRKEVLRLHAATAATVPLPAAGLPQPQPCGDVWRSRCLGCGARPGTVVFQPYEHLCLCAQCSAARRVCLHCSLTTWTGAVETATRGRGRGRGGHLPSRPWP